MAVRYRTVVFDSSRWEGFTFREDDIVISTSPKSGTTWMQMLCALLIFDATTFDRPMSHLSPWLDMQTRSLASVTAELEAQTHRRFIKTHTPLDGLPFDERVTYLCVGRDPRDVAVSLAHHRENLDREVLLALRSDAVGLADLAELGAGAALTPPSPDPTVRFWLWAEGEGTSSLAGVLGHLRTFWERRDEANIALFHYGDMSVDLPGQLRRLSDLLGIPMAPGRIDELAAAATFEGMRHRAEELAPNADQALWHSTDAFFHRGSSGQWRTVLDDGGLERYDAMVEALVPTDLGAWAHDGWLGQGAG